MANDRIISALSIGATAVMMLIVRRYADGRWEYINELTANTELAEGIEEGGELSQASIDKTIDVVQDMYRIASEEGVDRVITAACSSIRKASNMIDFMDSCKKALSLSYLNVLQDEEEAQLSFLGVTSDLNESGAVMQIDLGGCVTRIVCGTENKTEQIHLLPFGYLNLTDRYHLDHFLFFLHRFTLKRYIEKAMAPYASQLLDWIRENKPHIIVSGAIISSFVGLRNRKVVMDRAEVHGSYGSSRQVFRVYKRMARTFPSLRKQMVGVEKDRVRMIPGALLILHILLNLLGQETFRITASGVRSGLIRRFEIMENTEQTVASLAQEGFY